ncbi:MAG: thioesterase family protein [Alphaproteobacteria bacterium]|nr:thioesterase family protein [Alphaproteobacteria bacterium]
MHRLKLILPEPFEFNCTIPIRITDLNYGAHVGNHNFLALLHEARVLFFKSKGFSENNIDGAGIILVDAEIEFKNEILYPNSVKIWVKAANLNALGFDLFYKIEFEDCNTLCCKAKTSIILFDYKERKKVRLLEGIIQKLR